jgi:hypothetical protein
LERVAHRAGADALQHGDEGWQLGRLRLHAKRPLALTTGIKVRGNRYRLPALLDDTGT